MIGTDELLAEDAVNVTIGQSMSDINNFSSAKPTYSLNFNLESTMTPTSESDPAHTVSIILEAQVWDGSGIPFILYPIELVIHKDE